MRLNACKPRLTVLQKPPAIFWARLPKNTYINARAGNRRRGALGTAAKPQTDDTSPMPIVGAVHLTTRR